MKGLIYWDCFDNDSKRIYRFLESEAFQRLCKDIDMTIRKEHQLFDKADFWEQARDKDMLMFFTHGEEEAILKCRYKQDQLRDRYVLATKEDTAHLAGKRIIAICCRSAKGLGLKSTQLENPTIFFIGFEGDIIYSERYLTNIRSDIYRIYSDVFSRLIGEAYTKEWTAEHFVMNVKRSLISDFTSFILSHTENARLQDAMFHYETAKSMVVHGNGKEKLFPTCEQMLTSSEKPVS